MYWISINDVNDEPPRFNRNRGNYTVNIPENLEIGKDTGILLAVDDKDEGKKFYFLLTILKTQHKIGKYLKKIYLCNDIYNYYASTAYYTKRMTVDKICNF